MAAISQTGSIFRHHGRPSGVSFEEKYLLHRFCDKTPGLVTDSGLSKTNAAEPQQVLSRWSGFDARISPEALQDPTSEEAQTVLAKVRTSLMTALADRTGSCHTCHRHRDTPQIRISRRPQSNDEYIDFYRCLECGYEGPFVDYPNKN